MQLSPAHDILHQMCWDIHHDILKRIHVDRVAVIMITLLFAVPF